MSNFTTIIVDDERLARKRVRRLLALEPEFTVVAECGTGTEALAALREHSPDLMFLDVQMPEQDGFDVLRNAADGNSGNLLPLVIFTSAYEDYALRAFEVQAFDYLLKPFDDRRFRESLVRAKTRLLQMRATMPVGDAARHPAERDLSSAFKNFAARRETPDRIAIRSRGRVVFVKLENVDWFEAADNYVSLHCGRETHIIRETMNELESRLDPSRFLRVHRSAIVNLDRIKELQPWFRGDYRVILRDGTELTLTKTHREKLESRLLMGT